MDIYVMNVEPDVAPDVAVQIMRETRDLIEQVDGVEVHKDLSSIHMLSFTARDKEVLGQLWNMVDSRIHIRPASHHAPAAPVPSPQ